MKRQLVDVTEAKSFIEANWPNDPLLRQIAFNLLEKLPRVEQEKPAAKWPEGDLIGRAALLETLLDHFGVDLAYLGEDLQFCQEAVQFAPAVAVLSGAREEETIEWLKSIKEKYIHGGDDGFDEKRRAAIDHAISMLAMGTTAQKWIPVAERLPDLIPCGAGTAYSEAVNVLTSGRKVLTAIWNGFDFIADAEFWEAENEEITHWAPVLLPLPAPPKEG